MAEFISDKQLLDRNEVKDYSFTETLKASINSNIIGADFLQGTSVFSNSVDKDFSMITEESQQLLDKYDVPLSERGSIDAVSAIDLEEKLQDRQRKNNDAMIAYNSPSAMAMSFGVSMFDPSAWVIGGILGAGARVATKGVTMTTTQARLGAGAVGVGDAVVSDIALEKSLGNELTLEQSMINGTIGFGIGYGIGKGMFNDRIKDHSKNILKNGIKIQQNDKEASHWWSNWYKSSSDRLKQSDNPFVAKVGRKFTRSMSDTSYQGDSTINDILDETKKDYHVKTIVEFDTEFKAKFKEKNGRDFAPEDEAKMISIMHDIDAENTVQRTMFEGNKKSKIISAKIEEYNSSARVELENSKLDIKSKYNAEIEAIRESYSSKLYNKNSEPRVGAKAESSKRGLDRKIKSIEKKMNKEVDSIDKRIDKEIAEINKGNWIDSKTIDNIRAEAIQDRLSKIDELIDAKGREYSDGIKIINSKMFRRYGERINKTGLDGYTKLDTSFYVPVMYDLNKIADDTEGAVEAFKQGILDNFSEVDDEINKLAERQARNIVDNLSGKIKDTHLNQDTVDKEIDKMLLKTGKSRLKGRTLKLNRAYVSDYMNKDIGMITENYARETSANIALKEKFNIGTKRILDEDGNIVQHDSESFVDYNNIHGKDRDFFNDSVKATKGLTRFDPRANTISSKIVRAFNSINYLNFGGWFGVNTTTDLANIVNDFGLERAIRNSVGDMSSAVKSLDKQQSRKLARILGLSAESVTNDRAILMGMEGFNQGNMFKGEKQLLTATSKFSKYTGMNTVIDFMERASSMSGLDYILTKDINNKKFQTTMNRLGISLDEVSKLRDSGFAKIDNYGVSDVDFDKLNPELRGKLERGLRRAVRDTVLKANDLDTPKWLGEFMGSVSVAKLLFQFMRFPVVSHNKLLVKMANNFEATDAMASIVVGTAILGLTTQMKDIGREEPRYDLNTEEGRLNVAKFSVERLPFLGGLALPSSQMDIVGRMLNLTSDEEIRSYDKGMNYGITLDRFDRLHDLFLSGTKGEITQRDMHTIMSFTTSNVFYLQPALNMMRDELKD